MNTFLDLQATEFDVDLRLQVRAIGQPSLRISINQDIVYHGILTHTFDLNHQLPLLQPFAVTIELLDKDYNSAQETAAVIEHLAIDQFELIPGWTQLATYTNDHQYTDPTNYLGFVGVWQLLIDRPFYQWTHVVTNQGMLLQIDQ